MRLSHEIQAHDNMCCVLFNLMFYMSNVGDSPLHFCMMVVPVIIPDLYSEEHMSR